MNYKEPSPAELKADKKLRSDLTILLNNIRQDWSFRKLTTWADVYKRIGFADYDKRANSAVTLTYPDLKAYLQTLVDEQELAIKKKYEVRAATIEALAKEPEPPKEEGLHSDNNYGFVPSPNQHPSLFNYWFQKKAIVELNKKLIDEGKKGVLLLAGTGTGKTFMVAGVARQMLDLVYEEGKTFSHIPYLYVTRTTVVEQASRVLNNFYNIDTVNTVMTINIEQLRAKAGQFWIKEEIKIVEGEEKVKYVWKKGLQPCVLFLDESQGTKNTDSTQSQILCAYNDLKDNAQLVSISATPFTRVCEAKCFAVSTRRPLEHLGFPQGTVLTNENWPTYAAMIASPASPDEYNEAAIERLMKDLDDYIVRVRGVRPQFDAQNSIEMIDFETPEERKFYDEAWTRFQREMEKLEKDVDGANYKFVILLKFSMAAELCRAPHLAKKMYDAVQRGKAAVCACKFKGTIIKVVQELHDKYGVSRDLISLIWGGGQTALTQKQKQKAKIKAMSDEKLAATGMSRDEILQLTQLEDVEDRELMELPEHLRLGDQSMDERQVEIDKFQSGKSLYCLYTFRAGGVGLSLHHTDEMTQYKCKRKESGYAIEEDIPNVPVRPRENFVAPTYSAIELVQGLGRCPRLTSLSHTKQTLLFYRGTVEAQIAAIVSQKLRCLGRVVKQKEAWTDVIVGGYKVEREDLVQKHLEEDNNTPPDEGGLIDEGEEE